MIANQEVKKNVIVTGDVTMDWNLAAGWQYAPVTDKDNKLHADLVPWEELSDIAMDKDRDFVLAIPGILAKAGYTFVELCPMKAER
jgi:hypothetical protein